MSRKQDLDFSKCRYDVNRRGFIKSIEEDIPEFAQYDEGSKTQVYSYIIMLYDKKSPLWDMQQEYFQRKLLAAELALLAKNTTGNFTTESKEIIEGLNNKVNALTVAYLASIGDMDYFMLINELAMFHEYSMQAMRGKFDDRSYKTLTALSEGISERTRKVFGSGDQDDLTRVRIALYEKAERDRQKINPESIVKMLDESGDFPDDWNRYGKNYKKQPLKYYTDESEEG